MGTWSLGPKEICAIVFLCYGFEGAGRKGFECFYHNDVMLEVIYMGYLNLALHNIHTYQHTTSYDML